MTRIPGHPPERNAAERCNVSRNVTVVYWIGRRVPGGKRKGIKLIRGGNPGSNKESRNGGFPFTPYRGRAQMVISNS